MDPLAPRLPALAHLDAYTAADRPGAQPAVELARPVDTDRRPARAPESDPPSELSFADFLDVINPLQHIPLVGDVYRYLTGDQISGPARVAGGALFGGPIGFVAGLANSIVSEASGGNPGEQVLAAMFGDDGAGPVAVAQVDPPAAAAQAAASAPQALRPAPVAYRVPAAPNHAGGQPLLTGAAALQALSADLSGPGGIDAADLPGHQVSAAASGSSGIDARYVTLSPRGTFSRQLLEGLDKYKAMGVSPTHTLDRSL